MFKQQARKEIIVSRSRPPGIPSDVLYIKHITTLKIITKDLLSLLPEVYFGPSYLS